MKEYIHRFYSTTAFTNHINNNYYEPWVSSHLTNTVETSSVTITYNLKELGMPLTFEIVSGGTLYWRANDISNTAYTRTFEYRKNEGEWVEITSSKDNGGSGTTICDVVAGDIVQFRGDNVSYSHGSSTNFNRYNGFTSDALFYCYGNIMSLISSTDFITRTGFTTNYVFPYLFYNCTGLLSHDIKKLCLPAKSVTQNSYQYMFANCTSLTIAPELPATNLDGNTQYQGMFQGCTSLIKTPSALPATYVPSVGYDTMFAGCTSLVRTAFRTLPATVLGSGCYSSMFKNCTSLIECPHLIAPTQLNSDAYAYMFQGCTSISEAPTIIADKICQNGYRNMFDGCTSLINIKNITLPCTTTASRQYESMFQNCSSLVDAQIYIGSESVGQYTFNSMFKGCNKLEKAPNIFVTGMTGESVFVSMFEGCTKLQSVPFTALTPTTLTGHCYKYMFKNCTSLTTAPQILATSTNGTNRCCDSMFYGCSNLTTAPDLLSDTLSYCCYEQMFRGCSKLNYIKCLATTSISGNVNNWVTGVQTTSGTFVKAASMNDWPIGNSGIPTNWTVVDAS